MNLQKDDIFILTSKELDDLERLKETIEQDIIIWEEEETDTLTKEISWHTQVALLQTSPQKCHRSRIIIKAGGTIETGRNWVDGQQAAE